LLSIKFNVSPLCYYIHLLILCLHLIIILRAGILPALLIILSETALKTPLHLISPVKKRLQPALRLKLLEGLAEICIKGLFICGIQEEQGEVFVLEE